MKRPNGYQRGFTLIETAIVVTVASILLASAVAAYHTFQKKEKYETTRDRISAITGAMAEFQTRPENTTKRLPCPAPLHAKPGTAEFGRDVSTATSTCSQVDAALNDTIRVTSGGGTVRVGAVPVMTLGLGSEYAGDAWGRRFYYVISEKLADTGINYDLANGAITLLDGSGTPIGPVPGKTPFIVMSPGRNGAGGITFDGASAPNPCPTSGPERDNCAWAGPSPGPAVAYNFRAALYSESGNLATNFDDIPVYSFDKGDVDTIDGLLDGISDMTSNVFLGKGAGEAPSTGANNTATGISSMKANTTGAGNTAMGMESLFTSATGNESTAIGYRALRNALYNTANVVTYNTAIGAYALQGGLAVAPGDSGISNTAIGHSALSSNTTGNGNTAVGKQALALNVSGYSNNAIGENTMMENTTGYFNTAVGAAALQRNTTGFSNVAIGHEAMTNNTTGEGNIAIGILSLRQNTAGMNNTALGNFALENTTGQGNTAVGMSAMSANASGTFNTAVGWNAQTASGALTNVTVIGANAQVAGSNSTAIGANAVINTKNAIRLGDSNIGLIEAQVPLTVTSDERAKKDIANSDLGLAFIEKLRPVSYRMKTGNDRLDYGFIAQEVEKVLGERVTNMVVQANDAIKSYTLRYNDLIAPLVKAVQELAARLNPLEKTVVEQQAKIDNLTKELEAIKVEIKALKTAH